MRSIVHCNEKVVSMKLSSDGRLRDLRTTSHSAALTKAVMLLQALEMLAGTTPAAAMTNRGEMKCASYQCKRRRTTWLGNSRDLKGALLCQHRL